MASLNPLAIGASDQTSVKSTFGTASRSLNPLAIGASDQTAAETLRDCVRDVSIPWQSGHLIRHWLKNEVKK